MNKNVKRLLALLVCCLMLFTLFACGKDNTATNSNSPGVSQQPTTSGGSQPSSSGSSDSGSSQPSSDGGSEVVSSGRDTLNVAVTGDMGTLNPAVVTGDYYQVLMCIFEPLWDVTFDGEIIPRLGEGYEVHNSRQWTIHLKEGITFSNGNPFTAEDFMFSAELARVSGIASAGRIQDFDWDNYSIIDDYTIDMRWTTDRSENIFREIIAVLPMLDAESFEEANASIHPIGTGPYVSKEYVVNSHSFLERRDDYWGNLPSVKYLNFRVLAEPSQRVNALATGEIDIAAISAYDTDYVKGLAGINVRERLSARWASVGFNIVPGRLFNDINARRAVAHAIDRQAILTAVYAGLGEIMNGPMTRVCLDYQPQYDNMDDTYSIGYNLDLAKEYADKASLAGKEIVLITNGTTEHVRIAEVILNMLAQIGITVQINNYDAASFTDVARDPTMFDMQIMQGFAPTLFYGGGLTNTIRYSPIFTTPGSWSDAETFPEYAVNVFYATSKEERTEITSSIIKAVTENVLIYAMVDFYAMTAFTDDLPDPYTYSQGSILLHSHSLTPR